MKKTIVLTVVIGALIIGVGTCGVIAGMLGTESTLVHEQNALATQQTELDQQIAVLDQAALAEQAAEPAPTTKPASTATARPTATPQSSISTEEGLLIIAWIEPIEEALMMIGEYGYQMSDQFQMMADNPYVILNDEWITDTAFIFAMLNLYGEILIESTPPTVSDPELNSLLKQIDVSLNSCGTELLDGIEDYTYGLDNINADYISKGNEHIGRSTEHVNKVSDLLLEAGAYVDNL